MKRVLYTDDQTTKTRVAKQQTTDALNMGKMWLIIALPLLCGVAAVIAGK